MKINILNKIANDDKAPKKIRIRGFEFIVGEGSSIENYYLLEETGEKWLDAIDIRLYDEVEIIEEEQDIEYLGKQDLYVDDARGYSVNIEKVGDKINELIREINKLKKEGK